MGNVRGELFCVFIRDKGSSQNCLALQKMYILVGSTHSELVGSSYPSPIEAI